MSTKDNSSSWLGERLYRKNYKKALSKNTKGMSKSKKLIMNHTEKDLYKNAKDMSESNSNINQSFTYFDGVKHGAATTAVAMGSAYIAHKIHKKNKKIKALQREKTAREQADLHNTEESNTFENYNQYIDISEKYTFEDEDFRRASKNSFLKGIGSIGAGAIIGRHVGSIAGTAVSAHKNSGFPALLTNKSTGKMIGTGLGAAAGLTTRILYKNNLKRKAKNSHKNNIQPKSK
jgi:hypothetical protein